MPGPGIPPRPPRPTPASVASPSGPPPARTAGPATYTNGTGNGYASRYASWDDLVRAAPLPEQDLELPGGLTVRLRKLSRLAQHELNARALVDGKEDSALGERLLLLHGLIVPPMPDEATVEQLQATLEPAVLQAIVDGILAFSRLGPAEVAADDAAFQPPDPG